MQSSNLDMHGYWASLRGLSSVNILMAPSSLAMWNGTVIISHKSVLWYHKMGSRIGDLISICPVPLQGPLLYMLLFSSLVSLLLPPFSSDFLTQWDEKYFFLFQFLRILWFCSWFSSFLSTFADYSTYTCFYWVLRLLWLSRSAMSFSLSWPPRISDKPSLHY